MVVTIEIKQKTIFKKNFDLLAFIKKENLFYGSYNAYHVLRENRIDKHTIVFDRNEIGRGIEIDTENKNVISETAAADISLTVLAIDSNKNKTNATAASGTVAALSL